MNTYLTLILSVVIIHYLLNTIVDLLNIKNLVHTIPPQMEDSYDQQAYDKSQDYLKAQTYFHLVESTLSTLITIVFILIGGFNYIDLFSRSFFSNEYAIASIFLMTLLVLQSLSQLPFRLYSTFIIEEHFGFNKTSLSTFFQDLIKETFLGALIGIPIFLGLVFFFEQFEQNAWLISFVAMVVVQLVLMYLAPTLIMPLFNKFTPLENGPLKEAIFDYAKKENFALKEIFTMDGSKRSSKANAFFTGFGKNRRIVLFDTLIKQHSQEELLAVLAHEMGHFKLKHIPKVMAWAFTQLALMFFLLSLFIKSPALFSAFSMENLSVYASLIFFAFLYSPISYLLSIVANLISRKHEFEADAFSYQTYPHKNALIDALKKLSLHNLSNLTPHPLKVFLQYSHPPVIQRIQALEMQQNTPS